MINERPAVILLCGDHNAGKKYIAEYFIKARRESGASVECVSFRQAKLQCAIATLEANDLDISKTTGVDDHTLTTFPLSSPVLEFLKVVNENVRKQTPGLFARWIMMWIRLRFQNGCRLFIVPDLEYTSDVVAFQAHHMEFNLRFVHVVAEVRTSKYLKKHRLPELEKIPENIELEKKEALAFPRLNAEVMRTKFNGLFRFLDNNTDGDELIKNFQRPLFVDLGLRVDPNLPVSLFIMLIGALVALYYALYH
jgi:hypothetical protein